MGDNNQDTKRDWSYEEDERARKEAAASYFQMKSQQRAAIREENAARRAREAEEEQAAAQNALDEQQEQKTKKREFWTKRWKVILAIAAIVVLGITALCLGIHVSKLIPVGVDSDALQQMNWEQAVDTLEEAGFTKVSASAVEDLNYGQNDQEGFVSWVDIGGTTAFHADDRFSKDKKVHVYYHSMIQLALPVSSTNAKNAQYEEIVSLLESSGFVNITCQPVYDIKIGLFAREGEIDTISIDGANKFKQGDYYRPDAQIVIVYHAKNK